MKTINKCVSPGVGDGVAVCLHIVSEVEGLEGRDMRKVDIVDR